MDDLTFWSRLDRSEPDGCWPGPDGVYREAFARAGGIARRGDHIHHECLTRNCCNPRHLIALTPEQHRERHDFLRSLARYPIEQQVADLASFDDAGRALLEESRLAIRAALSETEVSA